MMEMYQQGIVRDIGVEGKCVVKFEEIVKILFQH